MSARIRSPKWCLTAGLLLAIASAAPGQAQTCLTASDMDESNRAALVTTAQRFFQMTASGDAASLKQNSIAGLASNFGGVEGAVKDNQPSLAGVQGTPRSPFLLKAEGNAPLERAEFLCGVFGANGQTANSAVFVIPNLQPGNYSVVTVDAKGAKGAYTVSFVLQQEGSAWRLGGFYVKPSQINGHDGQWFADQARQFRSKGQLHNAWFYHLEARELLVPVPFMSTLVTDKLYDEFQAAKPADLPPFTVSGGGKSYQITGLVPMAVGNDFDLVVKFQSADVSDTGKAFQDNIAVMNALVAKYPELRSAFDGVVARATEPSGKDYGTLLPMKSIK